MWAGAPVAPILLESASDVCLKHRWRTGGDAIRTTFAFSQIPCCSITSVLSLLTVSLVPSFAVNSNQKYASTQPPLSLGSFKSTFNALLASWWCVKSYIFQPVLSSHAVQFLKHEGIMHTLIGLMKALLLNVKNCIGYTTGFNLNKTIQIDSTKPVYHCALSLKNFL